MRKGEVLTLKESDIHYATNEININRTVVTTFIFDDNNKKTTALHITEL